MAEGAGADNRKHARVAARFSVTFREIEGEEAERLSELMSMSAPMADSVAADGPSRAAMTENISEGGISVTGDLELLAEKKIEKGKKLLVEFQLPGEKAPLSAVAVVAWSIEGKGPNGKFTAGLMFTGIDQHDLDKIQGYMAKKDAGTGG